MEFFFLNGYNYSQEKRQGLAVGMLEGYFARPKEHSAAARGRVLSGGLNTPLHVSCPKWAAEVVS